MQLIAGNWKMNGLTADLRELESLRDWSGPARLLVCPPATLLGAAVARLGGAGVAVGGQDCHAAPAGAHTGDLSAAMLADAGATHVIVGHSERRTDHGETDAMVRAKAAAALAAGLTPIVCVGETLAERDAGQTLDLVARQLDGALPAARDRLVIAYEPVWAIGTGRTPTLEQVAEVHAAIAARVPGVPILYGGSVNPDNAAGLLGVPHVGGALVGGASLKASSFLAIARAAQA
jgi:triosephosphate isomerase